MIRVLNHYISLRRLVFFLVESLAIFLGLQAAILGLYGESLPPDYPHRAGLLVLPVLVYELFFCWFDLYGCPAVHRSSRSMRRLILSLLLATVILTPVYRFITQLPFRADMLLINFVLIGVVVSVRWTLPPLLDWAKPLSHRILILGSEAAAAALARDIQMNKDSGIRMIGLLAPDQPHNGHGRVPAVSAWESWEGILRSEPIAAPDIPSNGDGRLLVIGTLANLAEVVRQERVNTVVVALRERRGQLPLLPLLHLKMQGVQVLDAISFCERFKGQIPIDSQWLGWMVFSNGCRKRKRTLAAKRLIDLTLSLTALLLISPLLVAVAILIKLDSAGPVLFAQLRPGLRGKRFRVYKFRSMYTHADPDRLVVNDDGRITRVGRILRRLRLDELPQLFNVLKGDMSLVGPRPEVFSIAQRLEEEIPYYALRHSVKPGITGWAQIRYGYCASLEELTEKFKYDLFYVKNVSLLLDFLIMFETIKVLIVGKGVR